jgi:Penicillin binding protein transpeptidase domain
MSDETPQKGWDSWFGADSDSSGDEEQAPTRPDPEAQGVPALPAAPAPPPVPPTPAPPSVPARSTAPPPPAAPPALPAAEPEGTKWTVPSLGAVLEGRGPDAQQTQVASASPDDQRTQIAQHRADPDRTLFVAPSPDSERTQLGAPNSDADRTLFVPPKPDADPTQAIAHPAMPTQALPGRVPQQSRPAPSGYARVPGQSAAPQENAVPGPSAQPEPTEAAAPPVPPPAAAAPPATPPPVTLPWETPKPAQLWGGAADGGYEQASQQRPEETRQAEQAPVWQQNNLRIAGQRPPAGDEFDGWDDEPARGGPADSLATGVGGGDREGSGSFRGGDGSRTGSGTGGGGKPAPRSRRKYALLGGAGGVVVIVVLALVLNMGGNSKTAAKPSGFQPTSTTTAGAAEETAQAFLAAWQAGDFSKAAQFTDDPAAALSALTSYKSGLNLGGLQLTAQSATPTAAPTGSTPTGAATSSPAGSVPFAVDAKVGVPAGSAAPSTGSTSSPDPGSSAATTGGASGTSASTTANWSYNSKLTAYEKNGGWWIEWDPALVAPNLTAGEKLVSVAVPPGASEVTDASGNDLSSATDPGVRNIAAALKKSAPSGQGTPGVEIELVSAAGTPIANSVDQLSKPVDTGVVKTTINPTVESAALSAVAAHGDSSMVVLQPTTGDILAVANNDGQNDFALTARVAPGSTNKIVTSTALLTSGLVSSPSQGVECPEKLTIDGNVFENDSGESTPPSTPFIDDFAESCNDAFAKWYSQIGGSTLAQTAEKYYGLNQEWNIGLGEAGPYYQIPSSAANGELAQELFGQGQLEAAPLAMASVAATVDTGDFKQPIVVPGQAQLTATPLPGNVQQDLQQMMKAVVYQSDGTAYQVFSGVDSTVYGKTGTADVGATQQKPNSWMVVYDPSLNLAIGCVVLDAGYGASFAGPEAAKVLEALQ